MKSKKTVRVSLTIAVPGCERKTPTFPSFCAFTHVFSKKTACKRIGKEEKWAFFKTRESRLWSWIQFSNVKCNHQFSPFSYAFTYSFLLRTRVNAQKDWKADVFRSQSRLSTVSETHPGFFYFTYFYVGLNAFLKILVCLGEDLWVPNILPLGTCTYSLYLTLTFDAAQKDRYWKRVI